jgi:hypothetical protein
MDLRISTTGTTTHCQDVDFVRFSDITPDVIKSLDVFKYFIGTPYEKHFTRGLYKKVFYMNNGWERIVIHIFKSKKAMLNFDLNGGFEV